MSRTTALVLTFLAVVVGALAGADPFGVPVWVQTLAGALAAGFAAIGIPSVVRPNTIRGRDVP